jgi:hypothetical protein
MKLTQKQTAVLKALTTEWQTPTQVARQLPNEMRNPGWADLYGSSYVSNPLKR